MTPTTRQPAPSSPAPGEELFASEPRLDRLIAASAKQTKAINELIAFSKVLLDKIEALQEAVAERRTAVPSSPQQLSTNGGSFYYDENGNECCRLHKAPLAPSRYGGKYCPRKLPDGTYCKTRTKEDEE